MQYLLTFRSLTYAQQAARMLERAGIYGGVVRVPKGLSKGGCSYGVTVSERHSQAALRVLEKTGAAPEKVFYRRLDGTMEEWRCDLS